MINDMKDEIKQNTFSPGSIRCDIFSCNKNRNVGWKRYTDPSTPTVTSGFCIRLSKTEIPAI